MSEDLRPAARGLRGGAARPVAGGRAVLRAGPAADPRPARRRRGPEGDLVAVACPWVAAEHRWSRCWGPPTTSPPCCTRWRWTRGSRRAGASRSSRSCRSCRAIRRPPSRSGSISATGSCSRLIRRMRATSTMRSRSSARRAGCGCCAHRRRVGLRARGRGDRSGGGAARLLGLPARAGRADAAPRARAACAACSRMSIRYAVTIDVAGERRHHRLPQPDPEARTGSATRRWSGSWPVRRRPSRGCARR